MDEFTRTAQQTSKLVTENFSTSFSSASTLFSEDIRQDIYNIYGLVRIVDEIVDSYQGSGTKAMLDELEGEVYVAVQRGFSSNLIVHSFVLTSLKYNLDQSLVKAFFKSMRMDISRKSYDEKMYKTYIYGSAEVIGLMCLIVFTKGDKKDYKRLKAGAMALGSAFQKVNFLRDIKDDYETRGRYYFPIGSYDKFSEADKKAIIKDIEYDFGIAKNYIERLPANSQRACRLAFTYYQDLLKKLKQTPAQQIANERIRVGNFAKLVLFSKAKLQML